MAPAPTVLVFGLRPERLLGTEGRIDAFLEPPQAADVAVLVDALRSGLEGGGAVVAIVPDWFDTEGLARLRMARSLLETERVAIHVTPLPPLAATTLASVASAAGAHTPSAGVLASLLGLFEAELHVLTWLRSVTGLSTPAPTVAQHMASLVPGTAFAVSSHPAPAVHRIGEGAVPLPEPRRPSGLAIADTGGDAAWLTGQFPGLPTVHVAPTPAGKAWWGAGKLTEGVLFPLDAGGLAAELTHALDPWPCRWCGEPIAAVPCPMCGHRGRPPGRRAAQHGAST